MSLVSQVTQVHHLAAGQGVSYNWRWKASKPSVVAVLPCGYADGLPRVLTGHGYALLRGQRVPLVGTICMDYTMLDVTALHSSQHPVQMGEEVVLWGKQNSALLSADEVAAQAKTISYELLAGVGSRVPRRYLDGDK
jgi:alanine racemase